MRSPQDQERKRTLMADDRVLALRGTSASSARPRRRTVTGREDPRLADEGRSPLLFAYPRDARPTSCHRIPH